MIAKEISLDTARRLFREELRKALQEEPNVRLAYRFKPVLMAVDLICYVKTRERFLIVWEGDNWIINANDKSAQSLLNYLLSDRYWSN